MSIEAKLAGLLLTIVGLVMAGWYVYNAGVRNGRNAVLVEAQENTIDAMKHRTLENDEAARKMAFDAKEASKDHAKEIDAVRKRAVADVGKRVPIDRNSFCGPAGAPEGGQTGSDGQSIAAGAALPEPFAGNLRRLAAEADEVNVDLRNLVRRADDAKCFQ